MDEQLWEQSQLGEKNVGRKAPMEWEWKCNVGGGGLDLRVQTDRPLGGGQH